MIKTILSSWYQWCRSNDSNVSISFQVGMTTDIRKFYDNLMTAVSFNNTVSDVALMTRMLTLFPGWIKTIAESNIEFHNFCLNAFNYYSEQHNDREISDMKVMTQNTKLMSSVSLVSSVLTWSRPELMKTSWRLTCGNNSDYNDTESKWCHIYM